ncbi:unnamed protein product [Schistosoma mattheei]|uniref:Uncharacterized protein n=1 Tax=Schistosoma mattheei TaxID=31246 RepID=A0AA85B8U9_9TREM|nr:unnamed protein product [Schistosoma mattheei]
MLLKVSQSPGLIQWLLTWMSTSLRTIFCQSVPVVNSNYTCNCSSQYNKSKNTCSQVVSREIQSSPTDFWSETLLFKSKQNMFENTNFNVSLLEICQLKPKKRNLIEIMSRPMLDHHVLTSD